VQKVVPNGIKIGKEQLNVSAQKDDIVLLTYLLTYSMQQSPS
jgi:hypothetical protein